MFSERRLQLWHLHPRTEHEQRDCLEWRILHATVQRLDRLRELSQVPHLCGWQLLLRYFLLKQFRLSHELCLFRDFLSAGL